MYLSIKHQTQTKQAPILIWPIIFFLAEKIACGIGNV